MTGWVPDAPSPIYDAVVEHFAARVVCECGKVVKARRDGAPVKHHKAGTKEWHIGVAMPRDGLPTR